MLPIEATPAVIVAAAVAALFVWSVVRSVARWWRRVFAEPGPCGCMWCRAMRPSRN